MGLLDDSSSIKTDGNSLEVGFLHKRFIFGLVTQQTPLSTGFFVLNRSNGSRTRWNDYLQTFPLYCVSLLKCSRKKKFINIVFLKLCFISNYCLKLN